MGQIITLGGGGFSMEPDNPALDRYILAQTGKDSPKVCFLPTASGDNDNYIVRFYVAFMQLGAQPDHLPLFARTDDGDIRGRLLAQDVIYVGGGSTVNMLAIWRIWGVDSALREAYEAGVVLAGISAGALCWYEGGVTDSSGQMDALNNGLGLLPGTAAPHYDAQPERRPAFQRMVAEGRLTAGYGIDESAGIHWQDGAVKAVVASVAGKTAYRVEPDNDGATETALASISLADG